MFTTGTQRGTEEEEGIQTKRTFSLSFQVLFDEQGG